MSAPQNSNNINLNPLDALHLETLNCLYGQAQNVSMQFPFPTLPASVPSPLPLPMHFSPPEANMNIMPMMLPPFQGFGNITSMPMAQATYPSTMPLYVQTEPSPPQAQMQFNHFYAQPPPPPPPPMPDYPPPPPPPPFGCNDNASLNFNAAAGHTFINGALYNTEYLAPSGPEYGSNMGMGCGTEHNDSDDDFYDPMSEEMPAIHGIRLYNPTYGPEGAIPKRKPMRRAGVCKPAFPFSAASESKRSHMTEPLLMTAMPQSFHSAATNDLDIPGACVAPNSFQLNAKSPTLTPMPIRNQQKSRHHRRQGRVSQSFGIVSPLLVSRTT